MKKELIINNGILHIINNESGVSLMSDTELDLDSDVCYEFIQKHVKRLLNNPAAKDATFKSESKVYELVKAYIAKESSFKEFAIAVCEILSGIMLENTDIPPADIVVTQFDLGLEKYMAILKLNHKEYYTHHISEGEGQNENRIVRMREMLPLGGKVDEACLIPFDPMVLRVLEKPYIVDGKSMNYFSESFLECETEISVKEAAKAVNEITDSIVRERFADSPEQAVKVKIALIEESIEEEGVVSLESVASKAFEDSEVKEEFIELIREAGIKSSVDFGDKFVKREFGNYKYKSSVGIELKVPVEICDDPGIIEFAQNEDGSLSVTLKNMRRA